jgi:pseudouridine synthase
MDERLQKIIAQAGLASRRGAERLIQAGRVRVNGEVVDRLGAKADPSADRIEVDGRPVGAAQPFRYFALNKPYGYITSLKDPRGRPSVAHFIQGLPVRVYPVGRLDMDSEGLLILTNDGELSRRLMHPRYHVPKIYRVKVKGRPGDRDLDRLSGGVLMVGDRPAAPAVVETIKSNEKNTWLDMVLIEGRQRQIRRMCSQVGHPVLKLKRTGYGPIRLDDLKQGAIRPLTEDEILKLKEAAGLLDPADATRGT